ncbi:MAG TPA: hypothetical protein VEQ61_07245 [Thermoleophilaceae bacterium]|nr:hypothetical protein [Thermoleophilaceae bacterium]
MQGAITIRQANGHDRPDLVRLAQLEGRPAPHGDALIAYEDGEARAAIALDDGSALADPFHLTDDLVRLLRLRATQGGRA